MFQRLLRYGSVSVLFVVFAAQAGGMTFTAKPAVIQTSGSYTITFALSAPADVEVSVIAGTNIVRHLAAGMLGATNPPPAPLQPGLAQKIIWDGKDDFGSPVSSFQFRSKLDPGTLLPLSIRVRAGMTLSTGGFVGGAETLESAVYGLATDDQGALYVATGGGYVADTNAQAGAMAWQGGLKPQLEGSATVYTGLAPQVNGGCVCKEARFDLDDWGRLYIPNALTYSVRVTDNAGNEITRCGYYGNVDDSTSAPGATVAFGWPMAVSAGQVDKGRIYVADTLNHRAARLQVTWQAEENCVAP